MGNDICFIFNYASHYRENIYKKIDKNFDCDIYFGDKLSAKIKPMDISVLSNFRGFLRNTILSSKFYWQSGVISLAFKPYKKYVCTGEVNNISLYILWLLVKLNPRKKTIMWGHGAYGKEGRLRFLLTRFMLWLSDIYMTYGEYGKNVLIEKGIPTSKLATIYNSLDYEKQLAVRKNLIKSDIYTTDNNLIFIGRLTPQKRLDLIFDAMSILKERGIDTNLTLLGDGEIRDELYYYSKQKGLEDNVNFFGACYDEKIIADHIYNADLCVSPGNIGLTAMHVMMYGCPAVTHNDFKWQMPEFEAIKEGKTGCFFQKDNADSLADSIENWLEYSNENRDLIRQNCYDEIDLKWNPNIQIKLLKEIL